MKETSFSLSSKPTSCLIMGVVNITPDSFSDGGSYIDPARALDHISQLLEEGADIIDIGAESSRPGAELISLQEERRRLLPVLNLLAKSSLKAEISVDTNKPELMLELADFGIRYINNIKGLAPFSCLQRLAERGHHYIAMHMQGQPASMQNQALARDAACDAWRQFSTECSQALRSAGFSDERIWLDPGIGFGKTDAANLALLQACMQDSGAVQYAVGISRKSILGRLLELDDPLQRDDSSKALELGLMLAGIGMIRTHEVRRLARMRRLLFEE